MTLEGDTLTIAHERLSWSGLLDWVSNRKASADVSVSLPASCPVELGVVSADAVVSGIAAPVKVKSVSGSVTLDGVRSDISAQTVSGDLETRGLSGSLHFTTVSGDLTVVDGTSGRVTRRDRLRPGDARPRHSRPTAASTSPASPATSPSGCPGPRA